MLALYEALLALRSLGDAAPDDVVFEAMSSVSRWQQRTASRAASDPDLAIRKLAARFALTETEVQVLWLLVAIAVDGRLRAGLQQVTGEATPDPTLGAIKPIVYGPHPSRVALRELSETGALRTHALIERADGGSPDTHETRRTWAISRRVLAFLHGDSEIAADLSHRERDHTPIDQLEITPGALERARVALRAGNTLLVCGLPGLGRRTMAWTAARMLGLQVLEVDLAKLSRSLPTFEHELTRVLREARLLARVPLLANLDVLDAGDERSQRLVATIESRWAGPLIATASGNPPQVGWSRPIVRVDLEQLSGKQRAAVWKAKLVDCTAEDAAILAGMAPLVPALVHRAAQAALAVADGAALQVAHVLDGIRTVTSDSLSKYASRVIVKQTWDDIVLPEEHADAIEGLLQRVRGRSRVYEEWGFGSKVGKGLGITALFSGPPGTGKTMVAGLIAKDLSADLFQVDVSKIVSKYIGETEKNLAGLFDAADATHAVLLFDEADSLFGKRTDVKSSNDRNANLETNFLLQRLESFQGICLLTTNHESSMDPAFQRRLSVHLRFKVPEAWEREHLWRAVLPTDAPVDAVIDFGALARTYEMSGGYIKNAVLRAAFAAASDGTAISMAHLDRAARGEYEAMGKLA